MTKPTDKAISPKSMELARKFAYECTGYNQVELNRLCKDTIKEFASMLQAKDDEMKELVETLEFYSKGGNFNTDIWKHEHLGYFTGKRAREALAKHRGLG